MKIGLLNLSKVKNIGQKLYYEELGNIESDVDFKFNCEKSEKKF